MVSVHLNPRFRSRPIDPKAGGLGSHAKSGPRTGLAEILTYLTSDATIARCSGNKPAIRRGKDHKVPAWSSVTNSPSMLSKIVLLVAM